MRVSLRSFRPNALVDSFFGILDIKLGCEIVLLFGLINKVAGVYGLITIFVGGSFTQLVFYAYSTTSLFAFLWALGIVKSEAAKPSLLVAHLYALDNIVNSFFHLAFYHSYWYIHRHDGRRVVNSQAQQDLIDLAYSRGEIPNPHSPADSQTDEVREALALEIWNVEKHYAVWTLLAAFVLKAYFVVLLYSYAAHLRTSTYHALPLTSRAKATKLAHPTTVDDLNAELEHEELERGASDGQRGKGNAITGVKEGDELAAEPPGEDDEWE